MVTQPSEIKREDVAKVLEGFDKGIFIRDISRDHESGWAVRSLSYLVAVGRLAAAMAEEDGEDGNR